jgi:hypothetical protein
MGSSAQEQLQCEAHVAEGVDRSSRSQHRRAEASLLDAYDRAARPKKGPSLCAQPSGDRLPRIRRSSIQSSRSWTASGMRLRGGQCI